MYRLGKRRERGRCYQAAETEDEREVPFSNQREADGPCKRDLRDGRQY